MRNQQKLIIFCVIHLIVFSRLLLAEFMDVTQEANVGAPSSARGMAVGDFNNDGQVDLYVVNQGENLLYRNNYQAAGNFIEVARAAQVQGTSLENARGAAFFDFNNDGFLDLLTFNPLNFFQNLGNDTFQEITISANIKSETPVTACAVGDYDRDGYPDIYLVRGAASPGNLLLKNSGPPTWHYIDRSSVAGVDLQAEGTGAIFFDYNNDGLADLYVINKNIPNGLFQNQGDGTFQEVANSHGAALRKNFTGVTTADYDHDGDLDLYLTVSGAPNLLLRNSGAPDFQFNDVAASAGVARISNGYTAHFGDYDNDGWVDLYVCSSFQNDALYRNKGDGTFENVASTEQLARPSGDVAAFLDFNNDGFLDIYTLNIVGPNRLYQNSGKPDANWLKVNLIGKTSSRQGVGARIRLFAEGQWQLQEVNGNSPGAYGLHQQPIHFGVGSAENIDSLVIQWPTGNSLALSRVAANQLLTIPDDEILPEAPHLLSPVNNTITNQTQPQFQWLAQPDSNGDSLHFALEISPDSNFLQIGWTFRSWQEPTGFFPPMPVLVPEDSLTFTLPVSLPEGTYWWRVLAFDGIGSRVSRQAFKLTIDTSPPNNPIECVELNGTRSNVWQNQINQPQFRLINLPEDSLQLAGFYYYWGTAFDGNPSVFQASPVITLPTVTDGIYYLRIRNLDQAGNLAPFASTQFIFKYDVTPPAGARAQSVAVSDTETFYVHWENTAIDHGGAGISGQFLLKVRPDQSDWQQSQIVAGTDFFYTGQSGHRYDFEVVAQDSAGNIEAFTGIPETSTLIDTAALDSFPPPPPRQLTANGAAPSPWHNETQFSLHWQNPFDRSGILQSFFKIGSPPQSNNDTTGSAGSQPPLLVRATVENGQWCYLWLQDGRGNSDYCQCDSVLLRFDATFPVINQFHILNPIYGKNWFNPNWVDSLNLVYQFNEQHPHSFKFTLNQDISLLEIIPPLAGFQPDTISLSLKNLIDGAQVLTGSLLDSAGNQTDTALVFFIDQTAPTGTKAFSPAVSNTDSFKVSWYETGSDHINGSGLSGKYDVCFRVNGQEWQNWLINDPAVSVIFKGSHGQQYDFEVAAYDNVGNREPFQNLPESTTLIDTTRELSPVPPEPVELITPTHQSYLNQKAPVLRWRVPVDLNDDSLHFKVEIAFDSLFQQRVQTIDSEQQSTGFIPPPPLKLANATVSYQLQTQLVDSVYWWRVAARDEQFTGPYSKPRQFTIDTRPPYNPMVCFDSCGTVSGHWQNQCNRPVFTWQGAIDYNSGVAGYYRYWGEDSLGESTHFIQINQFWPGVVESGQNFLRLRAVDRAGNLAPAWKTLWIFRFDGIPPLGTTARAPEVSNGATFSVSWAGTAVDSGGSGLTGFYDVRVDKDHSGNWLPWLEKRRLEFMDFTGEIGHYYRFEAAAWDSAGNREALTGQAECTVLCAPVNAPPEAPILLTPINGQFLAALTTQFRWQVPGDPDSPQLHFKIEFASDSLFGKMIQVFESKKDSTGFIPTASYPQGEGEAGFVCPKFLNDGIYWWRVRAHDGWIYGAPSRPFRFGLDTTPPEIKHSPVVRSELQQAIQIAFQAVDQYSEVAQNQIIFRIGGAPDSITAEISDDQFEIAAPYVTSRGLEYALTARDFLGNYARIPASGFYFISVYTPGAGALRPGTFPFGEQLTNYRLISVPLAVDQPSVDSVLVDDLGAYDPKQWRLFDYIQHELIEYPNLQDGFTPGNALWLICRNQPRQIDSGPGYAVPTNTPFSIALDSAAWTTVGNPFDFSISINDLKLANGDSVPNIITYEGRWKICSEFNQINPWEGYLVKSLRPTHLLIYPQAIDNSHLARTHSQEREEAGTAAGWQVQIIATCGELQDAANFIGVKKNAADGWDVNDLFEPPEFGAFVAVSFPHFDWKINPERYTTDFRSINPEGHYWDFNVGTSGENQSIKLDFVQQDSVPDGFQILLVNRKMKSLHSIFDSPEISFASGPARVIHRFRLIVGTVDFVKENDLGASPLPSTCEVYQNFPNPFNQQTLIRYYLPQTERVTLKIYNLLGQCVCTLIEKQMQGTGIYEVHWNGTNQDGLAVASGIYYFQIQFEKSDFRYLKKMVLVR